MVRLYNNEIHIRLDDESFAALLKACYDLRTSQNQYARSALVRQLKSDNYLESEAKEAKSKRK